ncbi:MAG: LysR family transcriptional regulator [Lentisphaerae bacterium]|nr:LysR family transcriptional regulator [Lentisphaerota bacterium]
MEIHQLRYFQAVARHGTFSRAAKACNVSQPSLSQQILKLEAEIGHALFRRTRRGALLTARGERLLPRAQSLLNELGAIQVEVCDAAGAPGRELAVGAIPTIAPYLLPSLIDRCLRSSPGLQFRVAEETTDTLLQAMREGRLDAGLASPPFPGGRDMTVDILMEDELLVTLPRRHPLCRRTVVTVEDVMHHPLVLMKEVHCLSRQTLEVCSRTLSDPFVSVDSSQLDTVLAMVETGLGITFTPRLAVASFKHRRVAFRTLSPQPATRQIALIYPKRRSLSQSVAIFRRECLAWPAGH